MSHKSYCVLFFCLFSQVLTLGAQARRPPASTVTASDRLPAASQGASMDAAAEVAAKGSSDRLPAVVVLETPSLSEHLIATRSERERTQIHLMRARLFTADADDYRSGLRRGKSALAGQLSGRGIPLEGQTETLLNAFMIQASEDELAWLRRQPGVKSASFSPMYSTKLDKALALVGVPQVWTTLAGGEDGAGRGIKIGIVDSGIDLSNPMFADSGFTAPPGFPKGTAADLAFTNNKVIVARNFTTNETDMTDRAGHGTFVASVAAGRRAQAPLASIAGVAPGAYLGSYKVFNAKGNASGSKVLMALDAAVADGMEIINFSGGGSEPQDDAVSISAINNAVSLGAVVVISTGNSGPDARTTSSPGTIDAALSVGASTNSRTFYQAVRVTAPTPIPNELQALPALPGSEPIFSTNIGPASLVDVSQFDGNGQGCSAFPAGSLSGKIGLLVRGTCPFSQKIGNVAAAGGSAAVVYNNISGFVRMDTTGATIPSISISDTAGASLLTFVRANAAAVRVSIDGQLAAQTVTADLVADFSSRGPTLAFLIKPDMVAPGQDIYAATQSVNTQGEVYSPNGFTLQDGTSFSAPMVAGAAAIVKQLRPSLRPADIKSALVNGATPLTTTQDGARVSVMNSGAGKMNLLAALATRLVSDPVSVTFGIQAPTSSFNKSSAVKLTNLGTAGETWTATVVPRYGDPALRVAVDQGTVTIPAGGSTTLNVTVSDTAALQDSYEGFVNLRSQADGQSINIPYWISFAQPAVNNGGVVNGASFQSNVAPGSIISLFGVALASSTPAGAASLPLPATLGGSSLMVNSTPARLFFTSSQQLNVQLPFNLTSGTVAGQLRRDGISSGSFFFAVTDAAPGVFTTRQNGTGPGAILNAVNGSPIGSTNPAKTGSFVSVFGTGLGQVNNPPASGVAASSSPLSETSQKPTVTIGGQTANVTFSGLAPGFVSLYQVNVQVPSGLAAGDYPMVITIGGAASNTVTISVN